MKSKYSLKYHPEARQRALWLIRDYERIKAYVDDLDGFPSGANLDGMPRGTSRGGSSTETAAIRRSELSGQLDIVDFALEQIPQEYRSGIWENIVRRKPYPDTANLNTWKLWKQKFVFYVAWRAGFLI